ncbi:hypothetical protein Tco_0569497 [Tanacetum coccineum]
MNGTCKSLTELEYFCEKVYKATTEKLDWINPEGRQYPHDLRQPLPSGRLSNRRIIAALPSQRLKLSTWHDYSILTGLQIRRDDRCFYKFKEWRLSLTKDPGIEGSGFFVVQKK